VETDQLSVAAPITIDTTKVTKRTVASTIGKVYDLLGFFSPVTIEAKKLLRTLWQAQLGWDTRVTDDIATSWRQWTSQLEVITNHPIKRHYSAKQNITGKSLHGFSDASKEAYGGVVYLKTEYDDNTSSTAIIISKARVVPLKGLTIPRAELTAAYTLAKLLKYCSQIFSDTSDRYDICLE